MFSIWFGCLDSNGRFLFILASLSEVELFQQQQNSPRRLGFISIMGVIFICHDEFIFI